MTPNAAPNTERTPTVAAIATGPRARRLCRGLRRAEFDNVVRLDDGDIATGAIERARVDVVVMDLGDPDDAAFAATLDLVGALDCPTALFVDRTVRARTDAAIEAGVGAYVVDGFKVSRLGAVVDMAIARHQARVRSLSQLAANHRQHAERAIIDRAKAILMDRDGMAEDTAYTALRKAAMNQNRRLVEVARLVIDTAARGNS